MPPYQYGNPANDFYLRQAQQLAQQYPYQQAVPPMVQPQVHFPTPQPHSAPQLSVSIVTNIEEANATKVDPFTSHVFIDTSNGKIYFKQMDDKFQSKFTVFVPETSPQVQEQDPVIEIKQRLSNIETMLGGIANAKPVPDVTGYEESAVNAATADVTEDAGAKPAAFSRGNGAPKWKK